MAYLLGIKEFKGETQIEREKEGGRDFNATPSSKTRAAPPLLFVLLKRSNDRFYLSFYHVGGSGIHEITLTVTKMPLQ